MINIDIVNTLVQAIELSDATLVNVGTCFTIPVSFLADYLNPLAKDPNFG